MSPSWRIDGLRSMMDSRVQSPESRGRYIVMSDERMGERRITLWGASPGIQVPSM
jgi:hypothetical protein